MKVEKVLRSLTSQYDIIVVIIDETKYLKTMKMEDLHGSLEARELRLNQRETYKDSEQTLIAHSRKGGFDDMKRRYSDLVMLMITTSKGALASAVWYLDSGCYNHMIGNKGWLININSNKKTSVKLADSISLMAEGMGKIVI
ncbi:uncharacterized protein LOC127093812 [Lathyrus oleraceus]|uniref:uncharacterized protein LOC127093812 n=1 Tax=Pisum sativum TaxID=3888 RepID=UPI0021D3AD87|nr:uncharacterized protein LOC127093812 [Pisum sativum]